MLKCLWMFQSAAYSFDLCAVSQLLHSVTVLCVVLQQDGHLEGGGLQRVPVDHSRISMECSNSHIPTTLNQPQNYTQLHN